MPNNVEAEGGELIIRNSFGDIAVIPKERRNLIKKYLSKGENKMIDNYVSELPYYSEYAEDGTIVPIIPFSNTAFNEFQGDYDIDKSII